MAAALSLLFVVIYPYTPTPIALSIGKTLIAATVVLVRFAPAQRLLVFRSGLPIVSSGSPAERYSPEIFDVICLRL